MTLTLDFINGFLGGVMSLLGIALIFLAGIRIGQGPTR